MATVVKIGDGTYIMTPDQADKKVLAIAEALHGEDVVESLVNNWIADRAQVQAKVSAEDMKAKFDQLPKARRDAIKAELDSI